MTTQCDRWAGFPTIRVRWDGRLLREFAESEEGRREDAELARERGYPHEVVAGELLERHRATIEIRDPKELAEIWWALCSGTFQVHHLRAAQNLADKLRPHVLEHCPDWIHGSRVRGIHGYYAPDGR